MVLPLGRSYPFHATNLVSANVSTCSTAPSDDPGGRASSYGSSFLRQPSPQLSRVLKVKHSTLNCAQKRTLTRAMVSIPETASAIKCCPILEGLLHLWKELLFPEERSITSTREQEYYLWPLVLGPAHGPMSLFLRNMVYIIRPVDNISSGTQKIKQFTWHVFL